MTPTMRNAHVLWDYLTAYGDRHGDGLLVVCGSYDLRVCDHACELFRRGRYDSLLITGKTGNWTDKLWTRTEASLFADRAQANDIPPQAVILDEEATNFAENIANARRMVPDAVQVTFVTKLNSVRRILATAPIQWPEADIRADGPPITFPDEASNIVGVFGLIEEMVGDIDRLLRYPDLGYQVAVDVPGEVHVAVRRLIYEGFGGRLLCRALGGGSSTAIVP